MLECHDPDLGAIGWWIGVVCESTCSSMIAMTYIQMIVREPVIYVLAEFVR